MSGSPFVAGTALPGEREGKEDPFQEFESAFKKFEETRAKMKEVLEKMGFKIEDVYMKKDEVERIVEEAKRRAAEEMLDDKRIEAVKDIVKDAVSKVIEMFKPAVDVIFTPKEVSGTRKPSEEESASQASSA
jgi:vacuolar-type H+-ATPase subunit I/STV1